MLTGCGGGWTRMACASGCCHRPSGFTAPRGLERSTSCTGIRTVGRSTYLCTPQGTLGVPAVYTLYYGLPDQRADLRCREHSQACERCRQASVSVLTALEADEIALQPRHAAAQAFVQCTPLEQLPFHDNRSRALYGYLLEDGSLSPALKQFLQQPQRGARAAARVLLDRVAFERQLQFSGVSSDTVDVGSEPLFDTLPLDRGHFREPYFQHILRGLRAAPPAYVMDALVSGSLPSWVRQSVAGVVIART